MYFITHKNIKVAKCYLMQFGAADCVSKLCWCWQWKWQWQWQGLVITIQAVILFIQRQVFWQQKRFCVRSRRIQAVSYTIPSSAINLVLRVSFQTICMSFTRLQQYLIGTLNKFLVLRQGTVPLPTLSPSCCLPCSSMHSAQLTCAHNVCWLFVTSGADLQPSRVTVSSIYWCVAFEIWNPFMRCSIDPSRRVN